MSPWLHDGSTFEEVVAKHGPWSAMSIRLPDGRDTREPAVDHRLKRLVQCAADMVGKPLSQCRVLDLACLEGHYGIEFALQGAHVVCVEIREANLAKTAFVVDALGLQDRCRVVQDDVRNLNKAQYGSFDVIVCSGILYHLPGADVAQLMQRMGDCCQGVCLIDTYVAMRETDSVTIDGQRHGGLVYAEHDEKATTQQKLKDLWASVDNHASFWFTASGVVNFLADVGFTSCTEVLLPTHPDLTADRRTFAAVKGVPVVIRSSPATQGHAPVPCVLPDAQHVHEQQVVHGLAFRMGKTWLPQPLKDAIKPTLRAVGVLKSVDSPFKHGPH